MRSKKSIETIAAQVQADARVSALFLGGSHGNGLADDFSDIDFVLVIDEGASDDMAALWRAAVEAVGEIVLWWDRTTAPVLINAITADWTRIDVLMLTPEQLRGHAQDSLVPLFDEKGLYSSLPAKAKSPQMTPQRFLYQVENFIRILGLLDLAIGRDEMINGVLGAFHLRNALVDLLVEETNAPHRGGILHLNRLLSAEQRALMVSMPAPVAEREAVIEANMAFAGAYLPRARKMADKLGVDWPERFEAVTWEKLSARLGVERPY